jgi:hypothetical protein
MKVWHPGQLKKSKSWGPFGSYQLNSTANFAHLPRNRAKWSELAVLFCWYILNGTQDFDFFNCHGFSKQRRKNSIIQIFFQKIIYHGKSWNSKEPMPHNRHFLKKTL